MNPHKLQLKVEETNALGGGVHSVFFAIDKKYNRFKAGQFLHLTLDEFDPTMGFWPESRVFSICTEPRSSRIGIVYSVKGKYTKRMEDELRVGKEVWVKLPYGEFIIQSIVEPTNNIVMIAGGTGISPFIPFLTKESEKSEYPQIKLYYGLRSRELKLFGTELERVESQNEKVKIHCYYENESGTEESGRLSIDKIWNQEYSGGTTDFLLSGPPAMIAYFKESLLEKGVPLEKIHIDDWE